MALTIFLLGAGYHLSRNVEVHEWPLKWQRHGPYHAGHFSSCCLPCVLDVRLFISDELFHWKI
jgi:hypothetical protein